MSRALEASVLVALLLVVPVASAAASGGPAPPLAVSEGLAGSGTEDCDATVVPPAGPVEGGCVGVEVHPDETSYVICYFGEEITICQTRTLPGYGSALP